MCLHASNCCKSSYLQRKAATFWLNLFPQSEVRSQGHRSVPHGLIKKWSDSVTMQMRQTQPLLFSQGQVPHLSVTVYHHHRQIFTCLFPLQQWWQVLAFSPVYQTLILTDRSLLLNNERHAHTGKMVLFSIRLFMCVCACHLAPCRPPHPLLLTLTVTLWYFT